MTSATTIRRADRERGRPFATSFLFVAAGLTIALAGARSIAEIVGPVFLALVLTVTLHPVRTWLERRRLPGWATSILMLLGAYVILFSLTLALILSAAQLASLITDYSDQLDNIVNDAGDTLTNLGMDQAQLDAVVKAVDPGQIVDVAMSLLGSTLGVLTDLFFLVTVLLFMAFDTDKTRRSLAGVGRRFPDPVAALGNFAVGARNYMGVSAVFGFIVATIDGAALALMGVPGAFVWAVLAFVTNFIPNIGFVIGVIPPALIALLEGGPDLMLAVIAVYCVINFVIQSIIQPRVVGDAVGLTPTLTFLSLVFWTWVIGPLGALLAVPLSLFFKALLVEADPNAHWALELLSGKPNKPKADEADPPVEADPATGTEEPVETGPPVESPPEAARPADENGGEVTRSV